VTAASLNSKNYHNNTANSNDNNDSQTVPAPSPSPSPSPATSRPSVTAPTTTAGRATTTAAATVLAKQEPAAQQLQTPTQPQTQSPTQTPSKEAKPTHTPPSLSIIGGPGPAAPRGPTVKISFCVANNGMEMGSVTSHVELFGGPGTGAAVVKVAAQVGPGRIRCKGNDDSLIMILVMIMVPGGATNPLRLMLQDDVDRHSFCPTRPVSDSSSDSRNLILKHIISNKSLILLHNTVLVTAQGHQATKPINQKNFFFFRFLPCVFMYYRPPQMEI
jgi:hypothetical protein